MPRLAKPRAAGAGATIGIAAPAFAVDPACVEAGEARLREAGFRTKRRPDLAAREGYLAGSDARRADELAALLEDPEVDAILCARGGYGCHRIVGRLDAARWRAAAKPLVGYSDATTLLLWLRRRAGLVAFHGPMLEREAGPAPEEVEALARALAGEPPAPLAGRPAVGGRAEGPLVGGSLVLLAASLGTPWEPDTRGAVLLLEEVGEKPYAIDRMLQQLAAAGKLAGVAGVGVGALVGCTDPKRAEPTAEAVLREALEGLGVPLVLGLPFGHARPNLPWPTGVRGALDAERGELRVLEAGVRRR